MGGVTAAGAEPLDQLTLDWSAPPGCPDSAAVRSRVESLLGASVEAKLRHSILVRGRVVQGEQGARVDLGTSEEGVQGERTIEGATCEEVGSAAALVIALSIDPDAVRAHSPNVGVASFAPPPVDAAPGDAPPMPPTLATSPPASVPAPALTHPSETIPAGTSNAMGLVDARAELDVGALPHPSLGLGLGTGFATGRVRGELDVRYFLPRFASAPEQPGKPTRGADVSLLVATASGCYAVVPAPVEVDACAGVETGALAARGKEFDHATTELRPWLAAVGSLGLAVRALPPFALRADLGFSVPFGRSPVGFRDNAGDFEEIYRPAAISGRAGIGLGFAFR